MKKKTAQVQRQMEDGGEKSAAPAGNQAMLSLLNYQRAPSGGVPLDEAMRARYERQFGLPMDDVRIHYNSDEPARYDADAFTYGSEIFVECGQEQYLPHELGHVAQQKMGLVQPTEQVDGAPLNRSPALERAADSGRVPAGAPQLGSQVPVLQLHPKIRVRKNAEEKAQELESPQEIWAILHKRGFQYPEMPEGSLDQAIDTMLKEDQNTYASADSLAAALEKQMRKVLQDEKYYDWLTKDDKILGGEGVKGYRLDPNANESENKKVRDARQKHLENLIKHEAKPLARTKRLVDEDGYIHLYHGSRTKLKEIQPAEPSFRDGKIDPSKDGFISVSTTTSGATPAKQGEAYHIKLTKEEFEKYRFREFNGSTELRTRYSIPQIIPMEKKDEDQ